jgi:hypothetical protein
MLDDCDDSGAPQRGRPPSVALRQPSAPLVERLTRSDSWWMNSGPIGFTARAGAERERMSGDVIGRKVPDQIMGQYLGIHRPVE